MVPRENKQYLCKILEGQTKSIMVFLKAAYVTSMLCLVLLQGPHQPLMAPVPKLINLS